MESCSCSFSWRSSSRSRSWANTITLVKLDQSVNQSWAQVQNVYQRRADLIPNLVQHRPGRGEFRKVDADRGDRSARQRRPGANSIRTRRRPSAQQLEEFQAAQGQLSNALSRLLVVSENYPAAAARTRISKRSRRNSKERKTAFPSSGGISTRPCRPTTRRCALSRRTSSRGCWVSSPRPFFNAQPGAEKAPEVKFDFGSPAPAPAATAAATP